MLAVGRLDDVKDVVGLIREGYSWYKRECTVQEMGTAAGIGVGTVQHGISEV